MCTDGSFERHFKNATDGIRALEAFQKCRRWDKIEGIANGILITGRIRAVQMRQESREQYRKQE